MAITHGANEMRHYRDCQYDLSITGGPDSDWCTCGPVPTRNPGKLSKKGHEMKPKIRVTLAARGDELVACEGRDMLVTPDNWGRRRLIRLEDGDEFVDAASYDLVVGMLNRLMAEVDKLKEVF